MKLPTPSEVCAAAGTAMDFLEPRDMLTVNILSAMPDQVAQQSSPPAVFSLVGRYDDPDLNGTIARFATVLGDINVLLFDQAGPSRTTPQTVANFLRYLNASLYNDTIFHRTLPGVILQGGGYLRPIEDNTAPDMIRAFAPIANEPGNANVRGTIAMARVIDADPNSATSQWAFNLANNTDRDASGYTVFGRVIRGLDVMDALAAVPTFDFGEPFTKLPLRNFNNGELANPGDFLDMTISTIPELTYSVMSSNAALVSPSLNGTDLTLTYGANVTGSATVTIRATAADGSFVDDEFTVRVNSSPVIANLTSNLATVGRNTSFTLTVGSATDDAGIARIDFYRDVNSNGMLDLGTDSLLGSDMSADGGWSLTSPASNFPTGTQTLLAIATDIDGAVSPIISTTIQLVNAAPLVTALAATPNPAPGHVPITLSAQAMDPDGSISVVRFYMDTNRNGVLDIGGGDTLVGEDSTSSDGFTTVVATTGFVNNDNRFFALATDGEGLTGDAAAAANVIANITTAPVISDLTANPSTVTRKSSFTLNVGAALDDVGVVRIDFYRDSNHNGAFDAGTDFLLGTDTSAEGGWNLATSGSALLLGTQVFFAQAADADGQKSSVLSVAVEVVSAAPVIALSATPTSVIAASPIVLSVQVTDADSPLTTVRFYRDDNKNGVLDIGTDTLVGEDIDGSDGYSATVDTSGLRSGDAGFFAVAHDQDLHTSNTATATVAITRPFGVEIFTVTPSPVLRNGKVTLTASQIIIPPAQKFKKIEFYADTNGNGVFDSADKRVGSSSSLRGGFATAQVNTKGLPSGNLKFFSRVQVATGAWSPVTSSVVAVMNNAPTIKSGKAAPATVKNIGDPIQLSVSGTRDVDGKITSVRYYRDGPNGQAGPDGLFQENVDILLGTVTNASGGFKLTLFSTQFAVGGNRYFAIAFDNDGARSAPVTFANYINAAPVVTALAVSSQAGLSATTLFTFTASGVGDPDGSVKQVEIFLDSNANGSLDSKIDKSLGKAKLVGNVWTLVVKGKTFPAGSYTAFARATDNSGGLGAAASATFSVS